jgi:hypothetical protein
MAGDTAAEEEGRGKGKGMGKGSVAPGIDRDRGRRWAGGPLTHAHVYTLANSHKIMHIRLIDQ